MVRRFILYNIRYARFVPTRSMTGYSDRSYLRPSRAADSAMGRERILRLTSRRRFSLILRTNAEAEMKRV